MLRVEGELARVPGEDGDMDDFVAGAVDVLRRRREIKVVHAAVGVYPTG